MAGEPHRPGVELPGSEDAHSCAATSNSPEASLHGLSADMYPDPILWEERRCMALKKLAHVAELAPCKQSDAQLNDLMSPFEAPELIQRF